MSRRLLAHVPRMLFGYGAAGFVAALMIAITDLVQNPEKLDDLSGQFDGMGAVTGAMLLLAFPVWLMCVIACEFNNARQLHWYALAGAIAALFPIIVFGMVFQMLVQTPLILVMLIMTGVAGGATYWAIAGRKAGLWKKVPE